MPQVGRQDRYGQLVEMEHLQQIIENVETSNPRVYSCSAPNNFECLRHGEPIQEGDLYAMVKLICNNANCDQSPFMHR